MIHLSVETAYAVTLPAHPFIVVTSKAPYRIYNIGNHTPVELTRLIELIELELGQKAKKNLLPMQPGDVVATCADVEDLQREVGFSPSTPIEEGIKRFVEWYRTQFDLQAPNTISRR